MSLFALLVEDRPDGSIDLKFEFNPAAEVDAVPSPAQGLGIKVMEFIEANSEAQKARLKREAEEAMKH